MIRSSVSVHSNSHRTTQSRISTLVTQLVNHLLPDQFLSTEQRDHAAKFAVENLDPSNAHYYATSTSISIETCLSSIREWTERFFITSQEEKANNLNSLLNRLQENTRERMKLRQNGNKNTAQYIDEENHYSILLVLSLLSNNNQTNQLTQTLISPIKPLRNLEPSKTSQDDTEDWKEELNMHDNDEEEADDDWSEEFNRDVEESEEEDLDPNDTVKSNKSTVVEDEHSSDEEMEYVHDTLSSQPSIEVPTDSEQSIVPCFVPPSIERSEVDLIQELLSWLILDPTGTVHDQARHHFHSLLISDLSPDMFFSLSEPIFWYMKLRAEIQLIVDTISMSHHINNTDRSIHDKLCWQAFLTQLNHFLYSHKQVWTKYCNQNSLNTLLTLTNQIRDYMNQCIFIHELLTRTTDNEGFPLPSHRLLSVLFDETEHQLLLQPTNPVDSQKDSHRSLKHLLFSLFQSAVEPYCDILDLELSVEYIAQHHNTISSTSFPSNSFSLPNFLLPMQQSIQFTRNQATILYQILQSKLSIINHNPPVSNSLSSNPLLFKPLKQQFLTVCTQFRISHLLPYDPVVLKNFPSVKEDNSDISKSIKSASVLRSWKCAQKHISAHIPAVKIVDSTSSMGETGHSTIDAISFPDLIRLGVIEPLKSRQSSINDLLRSQIFYGELNPQLKDKQFESGLLTTVHSLRSIFMLSDSVNWAEINRRIFELNTSDPIHGFLYIPSIITDSNSSVQTNQINAILQDCLNSSSNHNLYSKFAIKHLQLLAVVNKTPLSPKPNKNPSKITANRVINFNLHIELPWPYSLIVNSHHLSSYQHIFQFLFLIKQALHSLNSVKFHSSAADSKEAPNTGDKTHSYQTSSTSNSNSVDWSGEMKNMHTQQQNSAQMSHSYYLLRYEMLNLVIQLQDYSFRVLDKGWKKFEQVLRELDTKKNEWITIDMIREAHNQYIHTISTELLLTQPFKPAFQAVHEAVSSTFRLSHTNSIDSLSQLRTIYRKHVNFLLLLLREVHDRASQQHSHLLLLANSWNYNAFYKQHK